MLEGPDPDACQVNECLWGENVILRDEQIDGFCYCERATDGYPGYVAVAGLSSARESLKVQETGLVSGNLPEKIRVTARATLLFSAPDIKSPVVSRLPLLAEIELHHSPDHELPLAERDRFVRTQGGYYALRNHLNLPSSARCVDNSTLLELAETLFTGAPYLWGGRTPDGCDCSGLLQSAATLVGIALPRDSGPQEQAVDCVIDFASRQAGDLVFWPGHVGLLKEPDVLLHANAHSMDCRLEPLDTVIERAGEPSSIRRLMFS